MMHRMAAACLLGVALAAARAATEPPQPFGPVPPPPVKKPGPATEKPPASAEKPPPIPMVWRKDLDAAKEEAARTGLMVLIFFHADWCQPCRLMDTGTFTRPAMVQYVLQNFIPVKVDDSQEVSPLSKQFQVKLYPTLLFLTPAGEPLHMVLGPRSPAELYPLLEKVRLLPALIEAQKKSPDDLEANFAVGNALAALEPLNDVAHLSQLKRAEPYLKRAADLDPENKRGRQSPARLILALVPLEDGDSAAALKNIEQYLKDFKDAPEAPTAIFFQGTILFQDNKLEEARRAYERLRQEFPRHPKAYDADKAIEAIDARLRARPKAGQTPAAESGPSGAASHAN